MSKQESYSNHDKVILSIKNEIADVIKQTIKSKLYKLQFGYDADSDTFSAHFHTDKVLPLYRAKVFLRRNKISYKRIFVKANLHSYVSST